MRWFFPEFIFRELTLTKTTIRHGLHPKFKYVGSAARRSSSQLWILWTLCGRKQGWWKVKDPPVFLYKMYKNKTESCAMPPILMCFFRLFSTCFCCLFAEKSYLHIVGVVSQLWQHDGERAEIKQNSSVCFGPFVVFWFSFCPGLLQGIPVGLQSILSICIFAYLMYIYIYTHWHRRHESIMNTMFVSVYDCILNYVTACDCIHSFSSFPVVHKAKMPTLGMLMLDQKTSKKELGGFDHPGQAQRYETWVFNMNVQKDGKVKLTFMILMKVNRCSFGESDCPLSHCVHLTGSFSYQLKQEVVKGLTLDICHSGKLTPELEKSFTSSISALEVPRFSNTRVHALESNGGRGSLSFTVKLQRNWGSRSFGDLWRHGFHDVVSILGAEKHQVTSDSQLMLEGKACNSM